MKIRYISRQEKLKASQSAAKTAIIILFRSSVVFVNVYTAESDIPYILLDLRELPSTKCLEIIK